VQQLVAGGEQTRERGRHAISKLMTFHFLVNVGIRVLLSYQACDLLSVGRRRPTYSLRLGGIAAFYDNVCLG